MHSTLSFFQAIVMGVLQGVTELFPVSSLGHGVIFPALFGWHDLAHAQSQSDSFFLAFLVGLHVGTAVGLIVFYRHRWWTMARGVGTQLRSVPTRGVSSLWQLDREGIDANYRLFVLLVIGTIPVGVIGLIFEHRLRVVFTKPLWAAGFLTVNGVILLVGERIRRRQSRHVHRVSVATLTPLRAMGIGATQILALFAGISRSGTTMVAGLLNGLDHEESADFTFLLATPVILLAGLLKVPDLVGHLGDGIRTQAFVGALFAGVAAYFSVRFLTKWFTTRTLWPFGIYCVLAGVGALIYFA